MSQFDIVETHFRQTIENGTELGASVALAIEGELILDLQGGFADRARKQAWQADTLAPIFSCSKAVSALVVAHCIDHYGLDLGEPLSKIWPEFSQKGKENITLAQALSHQAGLSGFVGPIDPEDWLDWDKMAGLIAALQPLWPPGEGLGYHPITQGWLSGEPVRRAAGKSLGKLLDEIFCEPLGLDIYIGLPENEHDRVCQMQKPTQLPEFGKSEAARAAFQKPWSSPSSKSVSNWRKAEIPSANGHATARSLARLISLFACDGKLDGQQFLTAGTVAEILIPQVKGEDQVIGKQLCWTAGLIHNQIGGYLGPSPTAVGHYGWGGSCVFADPAFRLAGAYIPNRQSHYLVGDPRALDLIKLAYQAISP